MSSISDSSNDQIALKQKINRNATYQYLILTNLDEVLVVLAKRRTRLEPLSNFLLLLFFSPEASRELKYYFYINQTSWRKVDKIQK